MQSWNKEVMGSQLQDEAAILARLKDNYGHASVMINKEIEELAKRPQTQSVIWQRQYKENLQKNIDSIVDELNAVNDEDISDYLIKQYGQGHTGAMYSLQRQGVPLAFGVNQEAALKAAQMTGDGMKLSKKLYKSSAEPMKKEVVSEISRGFASGMHVNDIARNVENRCNVSYNRAARIARTEGGRVHAAAQFDAMMKAKEAGADVVKQWNAALDSRTRSTHQHLDGQIREIDEPFESESGATALHPHGFGVASEDINCRCAVNERARWALDEAIEKLVKVQENEKGTKYELMRFDTSSFEKFKDQYWQWSVLHAPTGKGDTLKSLLTNKAFASIDEVIDVQCSNPHVKALFYDTIEKTEFAKSTKAYEYWEEGKVYLFTNTDPKGLAHELGHMMDSAYPGKEWGLSKPLKKILKSEYNDVLKEFEDSGLSKYAIYDKISEELKLSGSTVSDTFKGLSKGSIKGVWGHPVSYYTQDKIAKEFTANVISAILADADDLKYYKKYFPKAVEYLEDALKKVPASNLMSNPTQVKKAVDKIKDAVNDVTPPPTEWSKLINPKYKNPEWDKLVTKDQAEAIIDYSGGLFTEYGWYSYSDLNMYLRKGTWQFKKEEGLEAFKKKAQQQADLISDALKKNALDEALVVNRYTNLEFLDGMSIGDVGTLKGFTSTTVKKTLKGSGSTLDTSKPLVHIYIPKGSKVGAYTSGVLGDAYEAEFLINHGVKFKYVKKKGNEVWLEIIDDGATKVDDAVKTVATKVDDVVEKASDAVKTYDLGFKTGPVTLDDYDSVSKKLMKAKSDHAWYVKNGKDPKGTHAKHLKAIEEYIADHQKLPAVKAINDIEPPKYVAPPKPKVSKTYSGIWKDDVTLDDYAELKATGAINKKMSGYKHYLKHGKPQYQAKIDQLQQFIDDGENYLKGIDPAEAAKKAAAEKAAKEAAEKAAKEAAEKAAKEAAEKKALDDLLEKTYDLGLKGGPVKLEDYNDDLVKQLKKKKSNLKHYITHNKGPVEKYKQQMTAIEEFEDDFKKIGGKIPEKKVVDEVVEEVVEEKLYDVGFKTGPIKLSDYDDVIKSLKAKKATLKTYVKQGKGDVKKYLKQWSVIDEYLDDYAKMGSTAQKTTQVAPKVEPKVNAKVVKNADDIKKELVELAAKKWQLQDYGWFDLQFYEEQWVDKLAGAKAKYIKKIAKGDVHSDLYKKQIEIIEDVEKTLAKYKALEAELDEVLDAGKNTAEKKAKEAFEKLKELEADLPEGYSSAAEALAKIEELEKKTLDGVWKDPVKIDEVLGKNIQGKLDYYDDKIAGGGWVSMVKKKKEALEEFVEEAKEYEKLKSHKAKLEKIVKEEEKLKAEAAAEIAFQKNADDFIEALKDEGKKDLAKAVKADPHSHAAEIYEWVDTQGPFSPSAYEPKRRDKCKLPKSAEKADDKYRSRTGEVWRSLSQDERHGAYRYTSSYHPINEPLRGIQYNTEKKLGFGKWEECASKMTASQRAEAKRDTIGLTRAIEKCWFDEDARLIRGNGWNGSASLLQIDKSLLQNGSIEELRAALIGKEVKEEGFTSTGVASGKGFLSKPVIFDIYAPKGTKMIYAEPFSAYAGEKIGGENWNGIKKQSYMGGEQEIIVQRGTIFKVRSVTKKDGKLHVSVDIVGQDLSTYPELM